MKIRKITDHRLTREVDEATIDLRKLGWEWVTPRGGYGSYGDPIELYHRLHWEPAPQSFNSELYSRGVWMNLPEDSHWEQGLIGVRDGGRRVHFYTLGDSGKLYLPEHARLRVGTDRTFIFEIRSKTMKIREKTSLLEIDGVEKIAPYSLHGRTYLWSLPTALGIRLYSSDLFELAAEPQWERGAVMLEDDGRRAIFLGSDVDNSVALELPKDARIRRIGDKFIFERKVLA